MRTPAQGVLAYGTILSVCFAGVLQLSAWALVAGACVLALISISNHPTALRALDGSESTPYALLLSSLLNASLTSAAALIIGRGIGWAWGV